LDKETPDGEKSIYFPHAEWAKLNKRVKKISKIAVPAKVRLSKPIIQSPSLPGSE
jgi:hypothetical protein